MNFCAAAHSSYIDSACSTFQNTGASWGQHWGQAEMQTALKCMLPLEVSAAMLLCFVCLPILCTPNHTSLPPALFALRTSCLCLALPPLPTGSPVLLWVCALSPKYPYPT